ncbi:hypothetical protein ACYZT8_00380 [Pseudomonas sp. LB3P93]
MPNKRRHLMHSNPYSPPAADCAIGNDLLFAFYVVSKRKLAVLFVATFGLYFMYWSYRNWKNYRAATAVRVMPSIRAVMSVWFTYALVRAIDRRIYATGFRYKWYPRFLALTFILLCALESTRIWILDLHLSLAMLVVLLTLQVSCLMRVQVAINYLADDASGRQNSTLSPINWIWIVLGLCWWGLLTSLILEGLT